MTEEPIQLKNIVYISIPEEMEAEVGDFKVNPSILLPVELPEGEEQTYLENLSWEMIVAAMLKVLAYAPNHEHADYYRSFILAVKPDIEDELTYSGVFKAKNQDYGLAAEIFLALTHLDPADVGSRVNLALVYEKRSEAYKKAGNDNLAGEFFELAAQTYSRIFEIDPDAPEARLNAGYFFLKNDAFLKAKEHLSKYIEVSEDKKHHKEVLEILEKLKARDNLDTLFKEAYDFIRLGKEKEGIERIEKFLETSPNISNAWFLLGWAKRRLGRYGEGKKAFLKAMELEKPHPDLLNELAICLMELGEYEESRKKLSEALRLEPENIKIISNLGILALKQDHIEDAKGFFKTVLDLEPEDPIAQKYLDFLADR